MNSESDSQREELHDRFVDQMLGEAVTDRHPPDLSEPILAASVEDETLSLAAVSSPSSTTARSWSFAANAASIALLLCGAGVVGLGLKLYWQENQEQVYPATAWIRVEENRPVVAFALEGKVSGDEPELPIGAPGPQVQGPGPGVISGVDGVQIDAGLTDAALTVTPFGTVVQNEMNFVDDDVAGQAGAGSPHGKLVERQQHSAADRVTDRRFGDPDIDPLRTHTDILMSDLEAIDQPLSMESLLKDRLDRQIRDPSKVDVRADEIAAQKAELSRQSHVYQLLTERVARMRTERRGPARVTPLKDATPGDATAAISLEEALGGEAADRKPPSSQFIQTQTALIRSPLVLERVAANPEIAKLALLKDAENPVSALARLVSVQAGSEASNVLAITFNGPDSKTSAIVANAIVEAYFKIQAQDEAYREMRVLELLEEERARRQAQIAMLKKSLVDLTTQRPAPEPTGRDRYEAIIENPFIVPQGEDALSTFSIDVDTASYANVRQYLLQSGTLPPPNAVRVEELVNYFMYDYAGPQDDVPFASHVEVAACPWRPGNRLVRVALKGKEIEVQDDVPSNLVFLIDVSGSMNDPYKLPLLKTGMKLLAERVKDEDRVAIVVYAGQEGLALQSTPGGRRREIAAVLDDLTPGGSTNGEGGIRLAYKIARENFLDEGVNRIILCTDGDFNVGVSDTEQLQQIVAEEAKSGTFLTVLGFGRGNLNDEMMETISNRGNGNYYYIDGEAEAQKVLVDQLRGTLVTIAKDVKIQIEFNPAAVQAYRLIGYENRIMAAEDFNNDKKDAGEIGAGHTVTAFYEIVPADQPSQRPKVDRLKYQAVEPEIEAADDALAASEPAVETELMTLKLRYKAPDGEVSKLLEFPVVDRGGKFAQASQDFQFGASVASFGMLLRGSAHRGEATYDSVAEIAASTKGTDLRGYREEFLTIVRRAKELAGR